MLIVGSILLAFFGIQITGCGVSGLKNRPKWLAFAAEQKEADSRRNWRWFGFSLVSLWIIQGTSMLTASILLWFDIKPALILGLWPAAFWLIVFILPKRKKPPEIAATPSN